MRGLTPGLGSGVAEESIAPVIVGCVALVLTIIGMFAGYFAFVSKQIANIGEMAAKDNEKLEAAMSRDRHDMRSALMATIAEDRSDLRAEISKLRADIDFLRERSASVAELRATESRLVALVADVKGAIAGLTEKVSTIPAISVQMDLMNKMLERLLARKDLKE